MNLEKIKIKFQVLKDYEKKLPGISDGFELLEKLSFEKKNILLKKNSKNSSKGVYFFDFVTNSIDEYCFESLNVILQSIYTDNIINNKVVLYNKLYWIFHSVLERNIKRKNYKYKNNYTIHHILSKFCHGLRVSRTSDITKYFVYSILDIYYIEYLEVNAESFCSLMFDFITDLSLENILTYNLDDYSIAFNPLYRENLLTLVFFSFELMLLGYNNLFNTFDLSEDNLEKNLNKLYLTFVQGDDKTKLLIKDMQLSLVVASSVDVISSSPGINNTFIDNVMYGIANKTK